jgi:3-hydroxyacyl-CoA dehydrogenase
VEGGLLSEYDAAIGRRVASVLCGGEVPAGTPRSEQDYLDLEREAFLSLAGEARTLARLRSLVEDDAPLRN